MTEQDDEASLPQSVRVITTLSHGVLCGYKEGGALWAKRGIKKGGTAY